MSEKKFGFKNFALCVLLFANVVRGCYDLGSTARLKSIEAKLDAIPKVELTNKELPKSYEINGQTFYLRTVDDKPTYVLE